MGIRKKNRVILGRLALFSLPFVPAPKVAETLELNTLADSDVDLTKSDENNDGKRNRRSSTSTFFLVPHNILHTSYKVIKKPEKIDVSRKSKTKERRSHSHNGSSDTKKSTKLAKLVRRESSGDVRKSKNITIKENDDDIVSNHSNGGSKSCDDLLDAAERASAIYAEIPTPSIGAKSFSGAVPTPYCTISILSQKPEETHPGAKSIILT